MAGGKRTHHRAAARQLGTQLAALSKTQRLWAKSITGWLEFLEKLADVGTLGDEKWKAKMRAHYTGLIQQALAQAPPNTEKLAAQFAKRLKLV